MIVTVKWEVLMMLWHRFIYNKQGYKQIKNENADDTLFLNWKINQILGYDIDTEVLKEVALKKLLHCYDVLEIIRILQYFKQLKGTDNIKLSDEQQAVIDQLWESRYETIKE